MVMQIYRWLKGISQRPTSTQNSNQNNIPLSTIAIAALIPATNPSILPLENLKSLEDLPQPQDETNKQNLQRFIDICFRIIIINIAFWDGKVKKFLGFYGNSGKTIPSPVKQNANVTVADGIADIVTQYQLYKSRMQRQIASVDQINSQALEGMCKIAYLHLRTPHQKEEVTNLYELLLRIINIDDLIGSAELLKIDLTKITQQLIDDAQTLLMQIENRVPHAAQERTHKLR